MYVVFDIGGTKTRVGVSRDGKVMKGEPVKFNTPENFEEGIESIYATALELVEGEQVKGLAGGIGGPLDRKKQMMTSVPKPSLRDWVKRPLVDALSAKFNAPTFLENDTAIVGLGEAHAGAGMGYNIVVYITVSTGVGGVKIENGYIDKNTLGFEPGHQIIDMDNTMCKKCASGHLEDMVSGSATKRRFGVAPYEVPDTELWEEELPRWLAVGLYNTILHWSPDVVVLGGSMIVGDPAISVPQTAKYLEEITTIFPNIPDIKPAELGSFGGMHGGLVYLRQRSK